MYFLPEQVTEYDQRGLEVTEVEQLQLFVSDEKIAIQWVCSQLSQNPMSFKELQPIYMKEAQQVWEKHEQRVELRLILVGLTQLSCWVVSMLAASGSLGWLPE